MRTERLAKKAGIYFIGNLSTKFLSVIVVFIYAFYINAEDLGKYEYIQTISNIILLSGGSGKRLWPLSNGTRLNNIT